MSAPLLLRLRVIDAAGRPLAGAVVRRGADSLAVTGDDGIAIVAPIAGFDALTIAHAMPAEAQLALWLDERSCGTVERTVELHPGAPLRGRVLDPAGRPLPGAFVEVWSPHGTQYVEADIQGSWGVPALRAGDYEVRARADGYAHGPTVSGTHDGHRAEDGVVLAVGTGATLTGRVRDATGQPVAGLRVFTELRPGHDRSTTTDDAGCFALHGLDPGRHLVAAGGWRSSVVVPDTGALVIELPPPALSAARAAVAPVQAPSCVTGWVIRDGAPVTRFAVVAKGRAASAWTTGTATIQAADGRFALPGLRGPSCTVHALALGAGWASTGEVVLVPGETVDAGDLVLAPGRRVAGTVRDAHGARIAGASVMIGHPRHDDVLLDAADGAFATTSGADGRFAFDGVALREDRNAIQATHPVHGASRRLLLQDAIDLVLEPTGSVAGEVVPYGAAHGVIMVRGDAPDHGVRATRVRPSGRFVVDGLVPGSYTICLVERPGSPSREARVTVVAGARARVRL